MPTKPTLATLKLRRRVKAKYPDWARLGGAALWDALESADPHPLRTLLLSDDDCRGVSTRTYDALYKVRTADPSWLDGKRAELFSANRRNNASVLGEIRAYGALLQALGERVRSQPETPDSPHADFVVSGGTRKKPFTIGVEVTTVLASTKNTRHDGAPRSTAVRTKSGRRVQLTMQTSSVAPLRFADKPGENVASQAVWQLMQRKEEEHQLGLETASVLWLDLADPDTWPLGFGIEQAMPLSSFNAAITSGALWWSLYGSKGDPIFAATSIEGMASEAGSQAFDGRFLRNSKADFVLADLGNNQIVFENPVARSRIPEGVYRQLVQLPRLVVEHSWLNWPGPRSLPTRVRAAQRAARAFVRAFRVQHHPLPEAPTGRSDASTSRGNESGSPTA